ncbi:MAG: SEC-C domain-containing protein [Bacilli bacterium]|nr:SEC-C domain-containing protein [Bacilli bacterium]
MIKDQTKAIFEKYNPADGVVRCPNGRAKMRKPLDAYAKAAVNLYGIIKRTEFVEIFNTYNKEQTTADEVYIILLPNVRKFGWYGFYKDYIVHYIILKNFDWVQYLEREQADKPRYIPFKDEFVMFEWEEYEDNNHWQNVRSFMWDTFGYRKGLNDGYLEIKSYIVHSHGIKELGSIMEKHDLVFKSEEQVHKFLELLSIAKNNTRRWENKGYTPYEMVKLLDSKRPKESFFRQPYKVGPNQPCPCGSGKKYKKCCFLIEKSGAAQLSFSEQKLFYETWLKLLDFVNGKLNVVDYQFDLTYPGQYDESLIYKIREKLWMNPNLISEFLIKDVTLSDEETLLLCSWEKHFIKGQFVLLKYEPDYAILMLMDKDEKPKLYAVKGITNSVADTVRCQLPAMLETVLLPFGEKIIYDGFFGLNSISFASGIKNIFAKEYAQIKSTHGIITKL